MTCSIAVLARQPQTRRQVARALYAGGMELRFIERHADLHALMREERPELLILDADSAEGDEVNRCLQLGAEMKIPAVLLSLGSDKHSLLGLLSSYEIANLVAKHGALRAVYPVVDERELLVTCQKVIRRDIFGLEKYVGAWGVKVHAYTVRSMSEKQQLISEFEGYLTDLECPPPVVPDILTVADELIVNGLVHAPRDEQGRPKYEEIGPVPELEVSQEDAVEVRWACDGQRLMFSVADRFGALSREQIYRYVSKGFGGGRHAVEEKAGGAGLGLAMSLKRLHQLVINLQHQVRTEVMAGWYLRVDTASDFRQVSKSINVFWLPTEAELNFPITVQSVEHAPRPPPLPPRAAPALATAPTAAGASGERLRRTVKRLAGRINERFRLEVSETEAVRLDLRGVTGFSSAGVIRWLDWMKSLAGRDVEVSGCPEVIVRAASEVEGLLIGVKVRSVVAPFECSRCLQAFQFELAPQDVLDQVARSCPTCQSPLKFSGVPHEYLAFHELVESLGMAAS